MLKAIIFCFLFCFSNVFAQSKATISGNARSMENENLSGANIFLNQKEHQYYVTTDSLGNFSADIPLGETEMTTDQLGYLQKSISFNFTHDTVVSIILEKDVSLLKEIIISNDKKKAISTLSGGKLLFSLKDLGSVPNAFGTTDIIKILQLTPGVQNSGDANGYLYVRGGDPGHNAILYAGSPIYGMSHLLGFFPFYNADHIKDVEFDKSSFNPKYGGRLSSTTLLNPNKKIPLESAIQGNIGILASQLTVSAPVNKNTGFYISGRKTYIDEIVVPISNSISKKNNDVQDMKYGFSDANFTFISQISKNNLFSIDAFISGDKLKIKDDNLALHTGLKWSNFTVSPSLMTAISSKTTMSNSFYFSHYSNDLTMSQATIEFGVSSDIKDFGFTNSVNYFLHNISFESGLQFVYHALEPQKISVANLATLKNNSENTIYANETSVFTSARAKLSEKLITDLGLRINYYASGANDSYLHFQPRAVLNYYANEKFTLYASYNRQYQYLSLITTSSVGIPTDFWIASSDGIKPQSSNEFSIGSNQNISRNFSSSIGGFYRSMKDLLEYPYGITQFNETTTLKNDLLVGKGKAYGLEMMLSKNNGKLKGWISYTLSWSDRNFDLLNNQKTYFAKYDRRHNLSITANYDLNSKWNFGVTQIFSTGNRFTMPTSWYFINNNPVKEYSEYNNAQMPNYIRTDIAANYYFIKTPKKESALNFSIYNTFNIDNPVYVVLNIQVNEDKDKVIVTQDRKVLYRILPSISWKFKF